MPTSNAARWAGIAFLVLLANSAYLLAFATPSIFYMANVLAHIALGALWAVLVLVLARHQRKQALIGSLVIATGAALVYTGAGFDFRWLLWLHIAAGVFTAIALVIAARRRSWALALAACGFFYAGAAIYQRFRPDHQTAIVNPLTVPATMQQEGAGPRSPFWPSSANTNVNGIIPSNFFMDSKLCGECHKDAYAQ
ncbi:MAG: hypothetical protein HZB13_13535, partial [Acidobacteria bacterium]|nr:hypothetical protein [Acidobacteriota bacterium]